MCSNLPLRIIRPFITRESQPLRQEGTFAGIWWEPLIYWWGYSPGWQRLGNSPKVTCRMAEMELGARALPSPPKDPSAGQRVWMTDSQGRKVKLGTDFYIQKMRLFFLERKQWFWLFNLTHKVKLQTWIAKNVTKSTWVTPDSEEKRGFSFLNIIKAPARTLLLTSKHIKAKSCSGPGPGPTSS